MEPHDTNDSRLSCRACGHTGQPRLAPAGPHLKATCAQCGAYIKFVAQAPHPRSRIDTMKKLYREMSPRDRYAFCEWQDTLEDEDAEAA